MKIAQMLLCSISLGSLGCALAEDVPYDKLLSLHEKQTQTYSEPEEQNPMESTFSDIRHLKRTKSVDILFNKEQSAFSLYSDISEKSLKTLREEEKKKTSSVIVRKFSSDKIGSKEKNDNLLTEEPKKIITDSNEKASQYGTFNESSKLPQEYMRFQADYQFYDYEENKDNTKCRCRSCVIL